MSAAIGFASGGSDAWLVFNMKPGAYNDMSIIEFLEDPHAHLGEDSHHLRAVRGQAVPDHGTLRSGSPPSVTGWWSSSSPTVGTTSTPSSSCGGNSSRASWPHMSRHHRRGHRLRRRWARPHRQRCRPVPGLPPPPRSEVVTNVSLLLREAPGSGLVKWSADLCRPRSPVPPGLPQNRRPLWGGSIRPVAS